MVEGNGGGVGGGMRCKKGVKTLGERVGGGIWWRDLVEGNGGGVGGEIWCRKMVEALMEGLGGGKWWRRWWRHWWRDIVDGYG